MRHPLLYLTSVVMTLLTITSCSSGRIKVKYSNLPPSTVTSVAEQELRTLFGAAVAEGHDLPDYSFTMSLDTTMQGGEFAYKEVERGQFLLTGSDPTAVTHAVHSLLEDIGYTFDITGITTPSQFTMSALDGVDKRVTPRVRWRGIRQHVNFPMDISSYPIDEAKEYVLNLLRLRFNKLAIHSYPGQWYEYITADTMNYAGHFFYGDRHYMYDSPLLTESVRFNDSTFCIPSAEKCFDDKAARSKLAIAWMQELITYAKEIGMNVQFSIEPRMIPPAEVVAICHNVVDTYPNIDALELITEETGGWGPGCTADEVKQTLATYFAPEVLQDSVITAPIRPVQSDLNNLYTQIGIITTAIKELNGDTEFMGRMPNLKMGIYCTVPTYSAGSYRLARVALPDNNITIMPSHGSDGVARAFDKIVTTREDLARTEVYSWIEFDGLMYLQQNGSNGISQLELKMDSLNGGAQCNSVLFNHWRTAENRTTARFAALSTLQGGCSPEQFYHDYATRLGIADRDLFAKAMMTVNEVDSYSTGALGNIGFCWVGAWRGGGSFTYMSRENMEQARKMYMQAGEMFSELLTGTECQSARDYLSFLGNRTLASVIYLKAFSEAAELRTIKTQPDGTIDEAEKQRAIEICNHALMVFDQYMQTHAQQMPDRGSEGTLVSVWNAPIRGLKVLRSRMGGVPMDEVAHSDTPIDAPPLPIFYDAK